METAIFCILNAGHRDLTPLEDPQLGILLVHIGGDRSVLQQAPLKQTSGKTGIAEALGIPLGSIEDLQSL